MAEGGLERWGTVLSLAMVVLFAVMVAVASVAVARILKRMKQGQVGARPVRDVLLIFVSGLALAGLILSSLRAWAWMEVCGLLAGAPLAGGPAGEEVEVHLRSGERLKGRLLDFGSRRYRVEVQGAVREVAEEDLIEIVFVGRRAARPAAATLPASSPPPEGPLLQAWLRARDGDIEEARALVEKEILERPRDVSARRIALEIAVARREPEAALRAYQDLVAVGGGEDLPLLKGAAIAALERFRPAAGWNDMEASAFVNVAGLAIADLRPLFADLATAKEPLARLVGLAALRRLGEKERKPALVGTLGAGSAYPVAVTVEAVER